MLSRWLAVAATAWTAGFVALYLVLVHRDGNSPAWWYVGLLVVGAVPLVAAATGRVSRPALVASAVVLALATLAGLASVGLLLLPALAAVIVAAAAIRPAPPVTPVPPAPRP